MNGIPILGTVIAGWQATIRVLIALIRRLLQRRRRSDACDTPRRYRDVDCLTPPPDIRARPDPFIYSQAWLSARGFAVTWDNPDFRLLDRATGTPVDRFSLLADHDYVIEMTIHNGSLMAALSTQVAVEMRSFGIGTPLLSAIGSDVVDVPAFGSTLARVDWHTPATGGHNCLIARIYHLDDANPANNVGQHNTDIATPASPERRLTFRVGTDGIRAERVVLRMNAYQLPEEAPCPETFRERASVRYLRALQARHDRDDFPVDQELDAHLSHEEVTPKDGELVEVAVTFGEAAALGPRRGVNVEGFDGDRLLGGVTAYVGGEVA